MLTGPHGAVGSKLEKLEERRGVGARPPAFSESRPSCSCSLQGPGQRGLAQRDAPCIWGFSLGGDTQGGLAECAELGICPARGLVAGPPSCTPAFPVRSARPRLAWVRGPHPRSALCCRRPESPLTVGPDLRRSLGSPRGWRSFHEEETPGRLGPATCEGRTQGGLVATVLTWEPSLHPPLRRGWRGRTVGRKKPGEATQVVSHPHHPSHGDVITQGNRDSRVPAVHVLIGPGAGTAPRCRLLPTLSPHAAPREGSPRVVVGHLCAGASGWRSRNPLPHRIVGQRSGCRGEATCCFSRSRYPGRFLAGAVPRKLTAASVLRRAQRTRRRNGLCGHPCPPPALAACPVGRTRLHRGTEASGGRQG